MTTVYLGISGSSKRDQYRRTFAEPIDIGGELVSPALMTTFVYAEMYLPIFPELSYREWVLDSGAFSVANSQAAARAGLSLETYIEFAKRMRDREEPPSEIYTLDVIGDWKASAYNFKQITKAGIDAIPAFHFGSPEDVLVGMAKDHEKVALGDLTGFKVARNIMRDWISACFSKIWPKRVHGFGITSEDLVLSVPWHTVDSFSWNVGPVVYGRFQNFGAKTLPIRPYGLDLSMVAAHYLRLERRAKQRWSETLKECD